MITDADGQNKSFWSIAILVDSIWTIFEGSLMLSLSSSPVHPWLTRLWR
jgi:hypothetical protein